MSILLKNNFVRLALAGLALFALGFLAGFKISVKYSNEKLLEQQLKIKDLEKNEQVLYQEYLDLADSKDSTEEQIQRLLKNIKTLPKPQKQYNEKRDSISNFYLDDPIKYLRSKYQSR